jgi:hypothetical protein
MRFGGGGGKAKGQETKNELLNVEIFQVNYFNGKLRLTKGQTKRILV